MIHLTLEDLLVVCERVVDGGVLLHSICTNHALVDGNTRLALAATIVMLGVNGWKLAMTNDEAYDLVIAIASSELTEVADVAERLRQGTTLR